MTSLTAPSAAASASAHFFLPCSLPPPSPVLRRALHFSSNSFCTFGLFGSSTFRRRTGVALWEAKAAAVAGESVDDEEERAFKMDTRSLHLEDKDEDVFAMNVRIMDLEEEIFQFMQCSARPNDFPTKEEMIAAGRTDLVEAITTQGGWLTYGWYDEQIDEKVKEDSSLGGRFAQEDCRASQERVSDCSLGNDDDSSAFGSDECSSVPSSSGRSLEMENVENAGIEGILSRLEKERNLSLGFGSKGKFANGRSSWRNTEHDPGGDADVNPSSVTDMWQSWSLQRAGFPLTNFEAAEIVLTDNKNIIDHDLVDDDFASNKTQTELQKPVNFGSKRSELDSDKNQICLRLQDLEADLTSALRLLRSRTNGFPSHKVEQSSIDELHRLSDAWEFQENEIIKARDKLRSVRAKLAVLEGKLALEIIEAKKLLEEKQKRLDAAQNASYMLHTACIAWPNPASEVLLSGSFDGWTSQRRMEKSSSGFFSLYLKLYPGRYEIKFIVDGVWRIDPLRPIVHSNGHENNLLIIP